MYFTLDLKQKFAITTEKKGFIDMGGRPRHREEIKEYWTQGEGLVQLKEWVNNGLNDREIIKNMGISRQTFYTWKREFPLMRSVFSIGRKFAAVDLENTMIQSARGFYYTEEVVDNKGNIVEVKKWQAPNSAVQIFLMKNWDKKNYRDRWELEHSGALPVILKGEEDLQD